MHSAGLWGWLAWIGSGPAVLLLAHPAGAAPTHQIKVSLFGQPCILQGPVDDKVLQSIHSLSPEQVYPPRDETMTSAQTAKALERVRTISLLPSGLDRYRDRLIRRLEAQLELIKAVESYRKDSNSEPIVGVVKKHLNGQPEQKLVAEVKKATDGKKKLSPDAFDSLFDSYSESVEADPEEEFHRAIQRLKVQYTCSFEEGGEAQGKPDAGQ